MKHTTIFFLLFSLFLVTCEKHENDYTQFVDPMIGTGGTGQTYPGATLPFGMVQLSPDTRNDGDQKACAGYHYSDSLIYGFSHTHLSGVGAVDYTDILFMPTSGKVNFSPDEYSSKFRHENEKSVPGYYSVVLEDYDIQAELTTTLRAGFHKYIYSNDNIANVIIDLKHKENESENVLDSYIKIVNEHEIEGYRRTNGWAFDHTVYFVARFSESIDESIFCNEKQIIKDVSQIQSQDVKLALSFSDLDGKELLIKVGISSVDIDGARKNLTSEIPDWDFEKVRTQAKESWNKELGRIEIESNSNSVKQNFYTAMYHTCLAPQLYGDVDGRYVGADHKIYQNDDYKNYTVFSMWDTFRALHPLFTIIDEKRTNEFVNVLLKRYDEMGRLPMWTLANNYTNGMLGFHATSLITDAWMKDIDGFDREKAYEAMTDILNRDFLGLKYYKKLGYLPFERNGESISKTLEYCYNDWCVSQVAKDLGKNEDYEYYAGRAKNYNIVFDKETKFFRGKDEKHNWYSPFNPFVNSVYSEGNAYQYLFVPQDIKSLIGLMDGENSFRNWLDEFFTISAGEGANFNDKEFDLIGQYSQGNEPDHHMPYLYNYVGQPWKTQKIVRTVLKDMYKNVPNGIAGNEDCGQMSAWYIFGALGFYPINPGQPIYTIGSPVVENAEINLENGNVFKIIVNNQSVENIYIQSLQLNGKEYDKTYLNHKDIMIGGELVFNMGSEPNKQFGAEKESYPPSTNNIEYVTLPWLESGDTLFTNETTIKLNCTTSDAQIRYTLDGTIPTEKSTMYKQSIVINNDAKLVMRAFKKGLKYSLPVSYKFNKVRYNPAIASRGNVKNGLEYNYYETHVMTTADFDLIKPVDSGICKKFTIENRKRDSFFGYVFSGLIKIPSDGIYTFYLNSNDGSRMYIDGNEIIENDGPHIAKEQIGQIGLAKGYHSIKIKYYQQGGGKDLNVSWKGPDFEKEEISEKVLFVRLLKK